jgi:hypothetical protein
MLFCLLSHRFQKGEGLGLVAIDPTTLVTLGRATSWLRGGVQARRSRACGQERPPRPSKATPVQMIDA